MVDIHINTDLDIRWKQRFNNFQKAYLLLKDICETDISSFDEKTQQIYKEATIQRFEYTVDLAWKVLKDKMEYDGITLSNISPKYVIKTAFNANYINAEEVSYWLEMIDARNDTSHDYDHKKFENIYDNVKSTYLRVCNSLYSQYSYNE